MVSTKNQSRTDFVNIMGIRTPIYSTMVDNPLGLTTNELLHNRIDSDNSYSM